MEKQIEKLEAQLKELKNAYTNEQKIKYESARHKHFKNGDVVTNGDRIVIVEWTENKLIGCEYEKGYFGGSIINGNRGLSVFKRDEFEKVTDKYFTKKHQVSILLTGIEVEEIKYSLGNRNCNPNKAKLKMIDCLDALRHIKINN